MRLGNGRRNTFVTDVRFASLADFPGRPIHVRFTPTADIRGGLRNDRNHPLPWHVSWVDLWVSRIQLVDRETDQ